MSTQFDFFDAPRGVPGDVAAAFERFAFEVISMGFEHYSADAVLHRVRWHFTIEKGVRTFKCNNNWTAKLARWFIARHPHRADFFALRRSKEDA